MLHKIALLLLCSIAFTHTEVNADTASSEILPLASQSLMLDVVKSSEKQLVAVGERGHLLTSKDGESWQQQPIPSKSTLNKVFFLNESLGWAVGHDSTIIHSRDGGATWTLQNFEPEKQRPFFDIKFFDENHGIAVGAYGLFYRTNNGGNSWVEEFHLELLNEDDQFYLADLKAEDEEFYNEEVVSILPHFNRLLMTGKYLYLAGEVGMMAVSEDFGQTWQLLDEVYMGSFFDIAQITQQTLLVVGLRGNIFSSSDNGLQWQPINSNTTALLNAIVSNGQGMVVILANSGVMLSSNDGINFNKHTEKDGKALLAGVWFNNKFIVASEVGMKILDIQ